MQIGMSTPSHVILQLLQSYKVLNEKALLDEGFSNVLLRSFELPA